MSNLGYFALGLGLLAVYLVAMAAVLFGAAGTLAVPMFWAYLVLQDEANGELPCAVSPQAAADLPGRLPRPPPARVEG